MISSRVCRVNVLFLRNAASKVKILNPSADVLPFKGIDAAKKPVSVKLEAGKTYSWCACGYSKIQPFCDGTHNMSGFTMNRPVKFQVEKDGEYLLCNCKQTDKRPICDGGHKKVSPVPRNINASRMVRFDNSPVYEGVARDLGYKQKDGGFQ
ncbi:Iron sulphur-containing domain, CDGSH-type, subfamily and Iron sulphur-containing domain, CDGSH-type-containing protein [Strongyloides ratti]|uniref:Iron sulphur-containing domain, CDGSH-type, subfamily and Iron sulphur-containing domain, CDGSH-type-containing protein n=1 Tax=Strongyloides ratti TaxID=34506 RepID=A0A090LFQ1_STRRB|nr:Iron sulphur-containing domain, CDGSH-type, subfamily and Iron sulphur-containing domain, CDGSH-type-containing protein [Strongyloides ratti]CEF66973.1 Iron sulphur-containing domain, CDGSH-type, subfamily and Iron sulphur-containing domain, CDGSH-type-containing protein [Strongyloides ratti]